jgi:hypothetical protein
MKKYLFSLGLLLSLALGGSAFATATTSTHYGVPQPAAVEAILNHTGPPQVKLGSQLTQKKLLVMKAVYDVAKLGGTSGTTYVLKDAAGGDAVLPANAIIWDGVIDTLTAFVGTNATISIGVNSTTDIKAATAITSYSGRLAMVPVGTAANAVKVTTANSAVTATIATTTLTAGKMNVFLFYMLSD